MQATVIYSAIFLVNLGYDLSMRRAERLLVCAAVMEDASRRSPQENASTSTDDIPNPDVAKSEKNDTTDASEEEEECADDQQTGAMSGNLLARFNMERDEPQTTGAKYFEDLQPAGLDPGEERQGRTWTV